VDQSKKQRSKKLAPADIFGNPPAKVNKDSVPLYQDVPPVGQIYERSRMGVFYENPEQARKKISRATVY
jgi:hypothetical protein